MSDPRAKDADATRAAILSAAQEIFARKSFDAAGVREVASEAGVNVALIHRYFGSKDALFAKAVLPHLTLDPVLDGRPEEIGARLPGFRASPHGRALRALALSWGAADVQSVLAPAVEWRIIAPVSRWLDGANSRERAGLILAQLVGLEVMLTMPGPLAEPRAREELLRQAVVVLQGLAVDGAALQSP